MPRARWKQWRRWNLIITTSSCFRRLQTFKNRLLQRCPYSWRDFKKARKWENPKRNSPKRHGQRKACRPIIFPIRQMSWLRIRPRQRIFKFQMTVSWESQAMASRIRLGLLTIKKLLQHKLKRHINKFTKSHKRTMRKSFKRNWNKRFQWAMAAPKSTLIS